MRVQNDKIFIIYDGRARLGDEDDASVLDTAYTLREARKAKMNFPNDSVIFECDIINNVCQNGRMVE